MAVVLSTLLLCSSIAFAKNLKNLPYHPMIFVHGGSGSASQFESQAMRFTTNGYPQGYINVLEYDSSFTVNTMDQIYERLDQLIADLKAKFDVDQVDVLGHSLGTRVMQGYLAFPARAANVSHYVNIDGYPASALPGGVPTLAIWAGRSTPGRVIVGALNVTLENQTHIQSATSEEAFFEMYKFFTDKEPETTKIVPEPWGAIHLAGRAVLFPENIGVEGATVEIYEIDGYTGMRLHKKPNAIYSIGEDGNWGPFKAKVGRYYEFVIIREGSSHHFYKEAFLRSDYFVRLLTSPVGGGVGAYMDYDEGQSNLVVLRDKEMWGDQGVENDILAINGVNVVNAADCPINKRISSIFVYDVGSDGQSYLEEPILLLHSLPFITGVDLFLPAANPPDGRIRLALTPRGGNGIMQVINVPNWPSTIDRISVQFNDFAQWDSIPNPEPSHK